MDPQRLSAHPKDVLGRYGEGLAVAHLTGLGYCILARNWRCDRGEIDIVARDGGVLVFCEVKTRSGTAYGAPVEAVDRRKLGRLRVLAARWLSEVRPEPGETRFDVVSVLRPPGAPITLEHLRGLLP